MVETSDEFGDANFRLDDNLPYLDEPTPSDFQLMRATEGRLKETAGNPNNPQARLAQAILDWRAVQIPVLDSTTHKPKPR